jgi:hypothetical protein
MTRYSISKETLDKLIEVVEQNLFYPAEGEETPYSNDEAWEAKRAIEAEYIPENIIKERI